MQDVLPFACCFFGWGCEAEHEAGPGEEKQQELQHLPHGRQQWTEACVKQDKQEREHKHLRQQSS